MEDDYTGLTAPMPMPCQFFTGSKQGIATSCAPGCEQVKLRAPSSPHLQPQDHHDRLGKVVASCGVFLPIDQIILLLGHLWEGFLSGTASCSAYAHTMNPCLSRGTREYGPAFYPAIVIPNAKVTQRGLVRRAARSFTHCHSCLRAHPLNSKLYGSLLQHLTMFGPVTKVSSLLPKTTTIPGQSISPTSAHFLLGNACHKPQPPGARHEPLSGH